MLFGLSQRFEDKPNKRAGWHQWQQAGHEVLDRSLILKMV